MLNAQSNTLAVDERVLTFDWKVASPPSLAVDTKADSTGQQTVTHSLTLLQFHVSVSITVSFVA